MLRNMSNDNSKFLIDNEIYRNCVKIQIKSENNYIINCKSYEEGTRYLIIPNDQYQPHNRD